MSGRESDCREKAWARAAGRRISSCEVGLLISLVLLVGSSVVPGMVACRRARVRKNAYEGLMNVVTACRMLYHEYSGWPDPLRAPDYDMEFGARVPTRKLINVLSANDGPGNWAHSVNPARIVFLKDMDYFRYGRGGIDQTGDLLDPWGTPVRVVLDSNDDGFCRAETGEIEPVADEKAIAWSAGPDRIFGTDDDVHSWRQLPPRH